jgi:hypothetical protein
MLSNNENNFEITKKCNYSECMNQVCKYKLVYKSSLPLIHEMIFKRILLFLKRINNIYFYYSISVLRIKNNYYSQLWKSFLEIS